MSSVVIPSEMYSPHKKKTKRSSNSRKLERVFSGFIILLICIIILELVFHFWISPLVLIDKVEISTDPNFDYSNDYLLKKAGLRSSDTFFNIKTEVIRKRLMLIPAIQSVSVRKVFPSILKIDIKSRIPIGLSLISTDTGVVPVMLDSEGVLFLTGRKGLVPDLPIVSGLDFPEIKDGMRIPRSLCSFLENMNEIKKSSPALYSLISELKFIKKGDADYEVLLYPENYKTRIRIGDNLDEKMLKYIMMVLEVISGRPGMEKLEEIDFRTGDIVYRIQGE